MISYFHANNFKSIKSLDLAMKPFMVLVGPNGSGKTNIVNALDLLGELLQRGTVDPVRERGYGQLIRREKKPARAGMTFEAHIPISRDMLLARPAPSVRPNKGEAPVRPKKDDAPEDNPITLEIRTTINGSVSSDDATISGERVIFRSQSSQVTLEVSGTTVSVDLGTDQKLSDLVLWSFPHVRFLSSRQERLIPGSDSSNLLRDFIQADIDQDTEKGRSFRLLNWQRFSTRWSRYLRDVLRVTRIRLDSSSLRRDASYEDSTRERVLGPSGEGLAAAVAQLRGTDSTPHQKFLPVLESLRKVFPRIEDVSTRRLPTGRLILVFRESGIADDLATNSVSDGVLHALALLMALYTRTNSSFGILAIEEPENAIHPWSLREMIRQAQETHTRQLIVTTHSETVVSAVERPEDLFVVEQLESQGTCIANSVDKEQALAAILRDGGEKLGQLWMGGAIGGVPNTNEE